MFILYVLAAVSGIFVESVFFQIPLTLVIIIVAAIFQKKESVLFLAVVAGLILDSLLFRPLGITSLFFLGVIGILLVYKRKFETNHILFGVLFTTFSSMCYILLFKYQQLFLTTTATVLLAVFLFIASFFFTSRSTQETFV